MTTIRIDILDIILLIGAAQGVLLAGLILHRHGRLYANRFLCVLMLSYSIVLVHLFLTEVGLYEHQPGLKFALLAVCFLVGPLHFLYVKFLTKKSARFSARQWLHFVPSVAYLAYGIVVFSVIGQIAPPAKHNLKVGDLIFNWSIIVQMLSYMFLAIVYLKRHTGRLPHVYATHDKVKLDWLRNITYIVLVVLSIFALENVLFLAHINFSGFFDVSSVLFAVSIYAMGYLGLSRSEVFMAADFGIDLMESVEDSDELTSVRFSKT